MTISSTLCDLDGEGKKICMEKKERAINLGVVLPKTCHVKGRHRLTTLLGRNNTFQLFSGAQQRGLCFNFLQFRRIIATTEPGQQQ